MAVALLSLVGCRTPVLPTPQDTFQRLRTSFLRGDDLPGVSRQVNAAYQKYSEQDPAWAWQFRVLQADISLNRGASLEVLSLLKADLPASLATGELAARKRMLEALAHAHLGDFPAADRDLAEAERICAPSSCAAAGEIARIGGQIELDRNRLDEAEAFFRASMEIAGRRRDGFLEVSNLLNLGLVAMLREHYDESIEWFARSRAMAAAIDSRLDEEKALGNLGWDYYKMGDFDRSLDLSKQAVQQARELSIGIDEIEWLNNVEIIRLRRGQFEMAERDYRRSLDLATASQNRRQEMDALTALAYIRLETGQAEAASVYLDHAVELAARSGDESDELYPMLLRGELLARDGDPASAEEIFAKVAGSAQHDASLRWESEQDLAGVYAQQRESHKADLEYRTALHTVSAARCGIHHEDLRMPFLTNASYVYDNYIDFLIRRGKVAEALKAADESRALTLAEGMGFEGGKCLASEAPFAPTQLARRTKATLLFYWMGTDHSYLWAIGPERMRLFPLPPAVEIEPLIAAYRKALVGPRDVLQTEDQNGERLYQLLVAPAAEFFHRDGRVIVIADGSLSGLSFDSLIDPQPTPHYWIEDVTLENASSLRLLAGGRGRRALPGNGASMGSKLLLVGNSLPSADGEFPELPYAEQEMRSVGKYFAASDQRVYDRGSATPEAYLESRPEQFAYIHFVAHGVASETSPLDSAVVLSPSTPAAGRDGGYKLYARDVVARPLRAELVTVSACRSAGARAYTGEGLVGLSWAFLSAGARNVIGALWDVSDASTPQLMDAMYTQLAQGSAPDAALRTAKLSLLHGQACRKPIYWAAFQLYTRS